MNFTFGICTCYDSIPQLLAVVQSIKDLNIPEYEIILAGPLRQRIPEMPQVKYLWSTGWTPQKKNMISRHAQYENLVLFHDYFVFDKDWYTSYQQFGNEWDVCSNPQLLNDGTRHFTDWVCWDSPVHPRYFSLPYDDWSHTKYQYQSGGYMIVKRDFFRENLFNESLVPGQPEDVEWSLRIRDKARYVCNPGAIVRHNKAHRDARHDAYPFQQSEQPVAPQGQFFTYNTMAR